MKKQELDIGMHVNTPYGPGYIVAISPDVTQSYSICVNTGGLSGSVAVKPSSVWPIKETVMETVMEKDLVKFFLRNTYYQVRSSSGNFTKHAMKGILKQSFGMLWDESEEVMADNPNGFHILCTAAQFAAFIIHRCDADEGINRIVDLKAEFYKEPDIYDIVAQASGVPRPEVKKVLLAASFSGQPNPARKARNSSQRAVGINVTDTNNEFIY